MAAASSAYLGRFDEALRLDRRAVDLDPLNAVSWTSLGETEFYRGQLDQGAADYKKALELKPDTWSVPFRFSEIYLIQGRPQEALPAIERVQLIDFRLHLYALANYALGREKEADALLNELIAEYQPRSTYPIATVYAFRNHPDQAFDWLDRAYAQRDDDLIATKVDPFLKGLHNDPRYAALLKKLNLPI